MRPLRLRLTPLDVFTLGFGVLLTVAAARLTIDTGPKMAVLPLAVLLFLGVVISLTVWAPHILFAFLIPLFVALPMLKVLVVPWIGPLKDALVVATAIGIATLAVWRRAAGERQRGDPFALALAAGFLGLYVLNLGGTFSRTAYDEGWVHGVRLAAEPLILLAIGMVVPDSRRALRWAMLSLVASAVGVALIGLWQQRVGTWGLVGLGYEWDTHVRTINGRLRSFGSLDEPFAYAAFLLSGVVAVWFYLRRSLVAAGASAIILAGLLFGFVRTSAIVLVALGGLWLARRGHAASAVLTLAASIVAAVGLLVANTDVSESRVVRADQGTYLTINGRTEVWAETLVKPSHWLVGRGVGEVGTAAERASFGVYRSADAAKEDTGHAIDNGYLAAVADVGLLGLLLLVVLLWRLMQLAWQAARDGIATGWIAAALLLVLLLDAVTRASFTGFPPAFLSLLLIGLALNAADEERHDTAAAEA